MSLNEDLDLVVSHDELKDVLKHDMQMRYRKILKAPLHLNTTKNLVLRQEWAKRFI